MKKQLCIPIKTASYGIILLMLLLSSFCIFGISLGAIVPSSPVLQQESQQVIPVNSFQLGPQRATVENEEEPLSPSDHYYFIKMGCYDKSPGSSIFSREISKKMSKAIINDILPVNQVAQFNAKEQVDKVGQIIHEALLNPQMLMNIGLQYCLDEVSCLEKFRQVFNQLVESYYKVPTDLKLIRDIEESEFLDLYKQLIDNIRTDQTSLQGQLNEFIEFILPCHVAKIISCPPRPRKLPVKPTHTITRDYPSPTIETFTSDELIRLHPEQNFERELVKELEPTYLDRKTVESMPQEVSPVIEEKEPITLLEEKGGTEIGEGEFPSELIKENQFAVESEGDFQDQPPTLSPVKVVLVPQLLPRSGGIMSMKEMIAWLLVFGVVKDVSHLEEHPNLSEKIKSNLPLFEKLNERYPNCKNDNLIKILLLWVLAQIDQTGLSREHNRIINKYEQDADLLKFMRNIREIINESPVTRIEEYNELRGKQPGRIGTLSHLRNYLLKMSFLSCGALERIKFSPFAAYLFDDFPKSYGNIDLSEETMRHFIYNLVYLK